MLDAMENRLQFKLQAVQLNQVKRRSETMMMKWKLWWWWWWSENYDDDDDIDVNQDIYITSTSEIEEKKDNDDSEKESIMDVNDNDKILRLKKWKSTHSNIVQSIQSHEYFFNCMIDSIIVI